MATIPTHPITQHEINLLLTEGMTAIRNILEGRILARKQPGPPAAIMVAEAMHNMRDEPNSLKAVTDRLDELKAAYPDAEKWLPLTYGCLSADRLKATI